MDNPITCDRAELYLAAAIDGSLIGAPRADLARHLVECERCIAVAILTGLQLLMEGRSDRGPLS